MSFTPSMYDLRPSILSKWRGFRGLGARRVRVAVVRTRRALVDIRARHTVSAVSAVTRAREPARRVAARRVIRAVVRSRRALVHVDVTVGIDVDSAHGTVFMDEVIVANTS